MSELEFESEAPAPGSSDQRYDDAAREAFRRIAERIALVDAFNPMQPRDKNGKWSDGEGYKDDHARWAGVDGLGSWQPPSDNGWRDVRGQNHKIYEPELPNLKSSYQYKHPVTGELKTVNVEKRLSSGVIMREPDGRTWLVKPKNGFGGYNYTFPKGGVEPDLSPQANAIKEAYEESGLKARITGWAGDYHGDTSVTRMYHAVREDGHPKDHGWETESVTLVHAGEMHKFLNRSRDRKIAAHHLGDEFTEELHPRGPDGKWISAGASGFSKTLKEGGIPHEFVHRTEEGVVVKIKKEDDLPSLEATAKSHGDFMHKGVGVAGKYYTFASTKQGVAPESQTTLDMGDLAKISGKKGSNEGGVYTNKDGTGDQYYIKTPKTQDHVQNELTAAALYKVAGVNTMDYVPVHGGAHVATVLKPLEKNNIAHFNADERHEAQKDFAVHAWLANWDAAGTGGDNQVIVNGKVHTVDTGGSLKYRAQGEPKGAAFGDKVTEIDTLRDPSKSPDAAALFGNMTNQQLVDSIKRVTDIPDSVIYKTVYAHGGGNDLADKLVQRKFDLAAQAQKITVAEISKPMPATQESVKDIPEHEFAKLSSAEKVKHLLMKGTTTKELTTKLGWKSIGIPANAAALNLKLEKTQQNGVTHYKGIPMTPAEIVAAKGEAKAAKQAKKSGAVAAEKMTEKVEAPKPAVAEPGLSNSDNGKISDPVEAATLAKILKNKVSADVTFHPAEGKPVNYQDTHSYSVSTKADYNKLQDTLKKYSYSFETYTGESNNKPFFGVKIAADYKVVPKTEVAKPEPTKAKYETGKPFITAAGHDINTPIGSFKQSLEEHGVKYEVTEGQYATHIKPLKEHLVEAAEIAKYHPEAGKGAGGGVYSFMKKEVGPTPEQLQAQAAYKAGLLVTKPPPAIAHPPATEAELTKAKKNVALQLQYVPGAPDVPKAHALIAEFNDKYAGETLTTHAELQEKVNAFKDLTAAMVPLQSTQHQAAAAKQAAAKIAQAEKAAAVAAKEAYTVANLHTLPDEEQREFWLKKTAGSNYLTLGAEAVAKHKYLSEHGVTPAEVGFIKAFTGSYSGVNENLRKGHMDEKEFAFKHIMQDALDKMPKHNGDTVYRKITIDAAEQANYVVGGISEWKAFNSTSKNKDTWSGNTHFTIRNPKTGVDVQKISSHPSEAEVIMPANTFYRVLSKSQSGGTVYIEMEEIVPFTKKKKVA